MNSHLLRLISPRVGARRRERRASGRDGGSHRRERSLPKSGAGAEGGAGDVGAGGERDVPRALAVNAGAGAIGGLNHAADGLRGSRSGAGESSGGGRTWPKGPVTKSARSRRGIWPVSGRTGESGDGVTRTAMLSGGASEVGEGTSMVGSGITKRNAMTRSPASACTSAPRRARLARWKGAKPIHVEGRGGEAGIVGGVGDFALEALRDERARDGGGDRLCAGRDRRGGSGRGPRRRRHGGFGGEVAGIAVPGMPQRMRSKRFFEVGIWRRTPWARSERLGRLRSLPAPTREGLRGRRSRDTKRPAPR